MKTNVLQAALICLLTALAAGCASHAPTSGAGAGRTNAFIRVHDPSTIIQSTNEFWLFYTGRGVPSLHSTNLIDWERGPAAITNRPSWVAGTVPGNRSGLDFWAPDIIYQADRYLLYYSVSTFGKNNSAIALASSPTLDPHDPEYHWIDDGVVVESRTNDNFNTIDPAVTPDSESNLWLSFGSFWSGIKLIQLDPATGKRLDPPGPMYSIAYHDKIEASYLYRHGGHYFLFVNWGDCCKGTNSTYEIRVGRSDKITGPYLDKDGKDLRHDGGTRLLGSEGSLIGPGHAGVIAVNGTYWFSFHYYDAKHNGSPTFAIRKLTWDKAGWPVVGTKALR